MSDEMPVGTASAGRSATVPLDPTDLKILAALGKDARISVATLAEQVNVSRANAYARLERLRTQGVILGYTTAINSARVGLGISAIVLISGRQRGWRTLRDTLTAMPEVEYCVLTTGEFDFLILVRVPDVETLRDVILDKLQTMEDVRSTQTIFVLDELLRRRVVLPSPS